MLLLPGSYQPIERKANGVFNGKLNKSGQVRSVGVKSANRSADKTRVSHRRTSVFACSAGTQQLLELREVETKEEVEQVAKLRAEVFYEESFSRFVASLKKQFAEKLVEGLQERIAAKAAAELRFCCLIAMMDGKVIGCADLRIPKEAEKLPGPYLSNVCVCEDARRMGVGMALVAKLLAVGSEWGIEEVFAHVEASNDPARGLYKLCGFTEEADEDASDATGSMLKLEPASTLGREFLLRKTLR
mmetsp:Transcript_24993/g.41808  ORF Transcript_24993/g.41808 Transcript_24993/m.41808 type:complete len:245 (-) Transcript_24993:177-911(-)